VAIIAASATVLVSVLSIVVGKLYESRALIQKEHREKKIPVYEDLIKLMFRVLRSDRTENPLPEKEMIGLMSDFTQRAMIWASDEVLATCVNWRRLVVNQASVKTSPLENLFLLEQVIFAIRRDLVSRAAAVL
jgi:hypothetical protein